MKSNLLQYYLNWNVKCYVLIILGISCLIVYVQQEYIIVPQIHIPEHTRSLSGSLLGYKTIP